MRVHSCARARLPQEGTRPITARGTREGTPAVGSHYPPLQPHRFVRAVRESPHAGHVFPYPAPARRAFRRGPVYGASSFLRIP
jgi:hypothetical protein